MTGAFSAASPIIGLGERPMDMNEIPLFAMLRGRLTWLDQRQRVVAQNVANADTPGFQARDLNLPSDFSEVLSGAQGMGLSRTQGMHIPAPRGHAATYQTSLTPDSETTPDGNSVVVEEQMLRMAESRMAYDAAIGFYQKSMNMLRLAARKPAG